ncbi:beta-ketoacyl synthase N-terminal-like domain-containing protein [Streptomyces sp. NPDC005438]|uniref:type I polyketide synthase n=1 Tax=Streptomyces sp. NPDC005438 TaxID=3156880 RepID=UPI0033AECC90
MTGQGGQAEALRTALTTVRGLRTRVEELTRARREPIAVTGIGLRLPGGIGSPDALHQALASGTDTVTELGTTRWDHDALHDPDPEAVGRTHMRHAALVEDVDRFDAAFFGIAPREAAHVDPQQRLLLQVAWEAFEDAGLPADRLAGSGTGVYVGANSTDYLHLQLASPETVDLYSVVGGTNCIIANRLSYQLDLRGPSMAVDSACSSSLVAVHLAVQALRAGEVDAALAGGVNLLLSPAGSVAHSKGLPLSADGRCKTFDAAADGYVRGEGVVAVVLKRLSDAVADGDRVYAVIRGTAVNQDGLTNGLTAPSGRAQRECVTSALRNARVEPSQISMVEAHGTGTSLGDPIEVEALAEVYGSATGPTCRLGSLKTNMGHLEAAAGLAGMVKAVLATHHRTVYPSLHLDTVNPHLQVDGTRLDFARGPARPWEEDDDHRLAAVSAFGAGGTNAHAVLGPAPAPDTEAPQPRADEPSAAERPCTLRLSATTDEALARLADRYADRLADADPATVRAVAEATDHRRTLFPRRLSASGSTPAELVAVLRAAAQGEPGPAGATGAARGTGRVAFVFPGQGPHWIGMATRLGAVNPDFAASMEEVDRAMRPHLGRSVRELIEHGDEGHLPTRYVQPALFAIAVSLAAMWRAAGVEPDGVIGHSMGEVAAAHVAGALSLPDAVRVICERSRLLSRIDGQGRMLVVAVGHERAHELCAGYDDICVAVVNSPHSTVLSGGSASLEEVAAQLAERNVFARFVDVDVASHSPQTDALRPALRAALADLRPRTPRVTMVSTVTGGPLTDSPDAAYWCANLREPVRFTDGVASLLAEGYDTFVELAPHPTLVDALEGLCADTGAAATWSLHRDLPDAVALDRAFGFLFTHRKRGPWPHRHVRQDTPGDAPVPMLALPTYPFARNRHWFTEDQWALPWTSPGSLPATATGPARRPDEVTAPGADGRAPSEETARGGGPTAAEVTETVERIVAETLGLTVDTLDVDAGFFSLGMDSMLAARARNSLARALGLALSIRALFDHPTAAELGAHLTELVAAEQRDEDTGAGPRHDTAPKAPSAPAPATPAVAAPAPDGTGTVLSDEDLIRALESELQRPTSLHGGLV